MVNVNSLLKAQEFAALVRGVQERRMVELRVSAKPGMATKIKEELLATTHDKPEDTKD